MKPYERRDDVDDLIDGAIGDLLQGQPRVTGELVRRAAGARPRRLPSAWIGLAASLVLAFGVWLAVSQQTSAPPTSVAEAPVGTPAPSATALGSQALEPSAVPIAAEARSRPRRSLARNRAESEPYEGLPRLVIAPIDAPQPLSAEMQGPDALVLTGIQIQPLSVTSIADDSPIQDQGVLQQ